MAEIIPAHQLCFVRSKKVSSCWFQFFWCRKSTFRWSASSRLRSGRRHFVVCLPCLWPIHCHQVRTKGFEVKMFKRPIWKCSIHRDRIQSFRAIFVVGCSGKATSSNVRMRTSPTTTTARTLKTSAPISETKNKIKNFLVTAKYFMLATNFLDLRLTAFNKNTN